jgi:transketolase
VAECTSATHPVPVQRVGFPGFMPTGSIASLFEEFGLSRDGIAGAARIAIRRKGA